VKWQTVSAPGQPHNLCGIALKEIASIKGEITSKPTDKGGFENGCFVKEIASIKGDIASEPTDKGGFENASFVIHLKNEVVVSLCAEASGHLILTSISAATNKTQTYEDDTGDLPFDAGFTTHLRTDRDPHCH
jgi:hypothetical protein